MNCTQVVETMPAVTTIRMTTTPTISTPIAKLDTPRTRRQSQQRLDQRPGPDHLRDQVEQADDQRADRGRQLDPAAVELAVQRVGERELAPAA